MDWEWMKRPRNGHDGVPSHMHGVRSKIKALAELIILAQVSAKNARLLEIKDGREASEQATEDGPICSADVIL